MFVAALRCQISSVEIMLYLTGVNLVKSVWRIADDGVEAGVVGGEDVGEFFVPVEGVDSVSGFFV